MTSDILGIFLIVFVALFALTILSTVLMFVLRNERAQKIAFYFTAISAAVIAVNFAGMTPFYMIGDYLIAALIGGLAIAGVLVERLAKGEDKAKKFKLAKIMVAVSALASMISLMFF